MGLTQVSKDGVKNDAIDASKLPANSVSASELADNAVDTNAIADQAVALSKLPHGDSNNNGKFLRANNGADPSFESIPAGTTINNNADNRVITGSGTANTLEGEANLTFNGSALGVKTASPIGTLDVYDGTFCLTKPSDNSSSRNWRFLADNAAAGNLGLQVSTAAGGSTFSNVVEIDSSGKVGIGNSNPAFMLDARGATENTLRVGNTNETGHGTHNAKIVAGNSYYQDLKFQSSDVKFETYNGSSLGERFRVRNDGGVTFNGDTAAANALNDYEEGTWDAAVQTGSVHSNYNKMSYTKVGQVVHIQGQFRIDSATTKVVVTSLPFTVKGQDEGEGYPAIAIYSHGNDIAAGTLYLIGYVSPGSTQLDIRGVRDNTSTDDVIGTSNGYFMIGGSYLAA